jgi:hypothetical protein
MIEINNLKKGEFLLNNYISSCISTCEKGIYSYIFCQNLTMNKSKVLEEEILTPQIYNRGGMK